jgi:hypothetical protein
MKQQAQNLSPITASTVQALKDQTEQLLQVEIPKMGEHMSRKTLHSINHAQQHSY